MRIVFVGAGNLATRLSLALRTAGHDIIQVYSRTMASAETLAARLGCKATCSADEIDREAEVYIFSVKDNVLETLAAQIVPGREQALFLHTAGSMPLDVFKPWATRYGVCYPMQTFSKSREVDFSEIPVFIEASGAVELAQIERLAASVSGNVRELDTSRRRYLHLAAVFACNFANHCYALAEEILARHDIPFDVMLPLVKETARKVEQLSPREAQTGPAVRYDENVINRQAAMLADEPEWKNIYESMSRSIHRLAIEKPDKS